jgi:hypothetical protein
MDQETLFEEVRTRLREAQADTVSSPWIYQDEDIIWATRSAIRNLRALGVTIELDMDSSGDFDTDPTELIGVLVALKICVDLLRGDLTNKLQMGELGVNIRSVVDSYSTVESARAFQKVADAYEKDFKTLLTIVLTNGVDAASTVFGQQGTSFSGN